MWLPGTAAAMPAIIAASVASMRSRDRRRRLADEERPGGVAVPAVEDRAGIDRHDLAVRMVRSPGMPWTISWSIEMQTLAGNGRRGLAPG